ncbi:autophagy-related protein 2 homolog A-like [Athene noctua]|uniref:autophagy-related protein 2 homolog A-like n=1 Tax=Athene noctua TaxID=126797 RepID=UPI003EBA8CAA
MRRWAPAWPEALKARAARYALERSLGPFLEERLRLEQLSLDLRGGTGTLRDLRLQAAAVDEVLAEAGAPLELQEGCVSAVTVTVPWAALGSRPCHLRVTGLRLALCPRQQGGSGPGPPPSGRQKLGRGPPPEPPPFEGLEALALTIDGVLRRLRVELEDTVLRVELPPGGAQPGVALELRVPWLEYQDEGGLDGGPPAVLHKGLRLRDLRLFCQELPPPRDPPEEAPPPRAGGVQPGPSELALRLKQKEALPGPTVEAEGRVGALLLVLPPPLLRALLGALGPPDPGPPPSGRSRPLGPRDLELLEQELSRCLRGGRDPPSPPGGDPDSELFYSMTGSLGGDSAPPSASPPPSPAVSPWRWAPSPQSSAPPGWCPPHRGGVRLRVTLGTVMAALPRGGVAPPGLL